MGWLLAAVVLIAVIAGSVFIAGALELPTITGRVTDAGGVGIPGVRVRAVDSATYMTNEYGSAITGIDGYYTMPVDAIGSVVVMFDPRESNLMYATDYIGEFYNDAQWVLSATYVPLDSSGIDAELATGGSVSGTVYAPDGVTEVADIAVVANTGSVFSPDTLTQPDGTYVLRGVTAGGATIMARPADYNATNGTDFTDGSASTTVISGSETSGVDITLGQGGRIEGTVTGGGLGLDQVQVSAQDASNMMGPLFSAYTASDGTYVLYGVPEGADYRVYYSPTTHNAIYSAGYAAEYYQDARLAADYTPVAVTAGSTTDLIDAELELGGSISGTVYAADGITPLAGVFVREVMGAASDTTDVNGQYTLGGLNTASYRVYFDPTDYNIANGTTFSPEYYNDTPDFMSAAYIPVTFGVDTAGIDATLAEAASGTGTIAGVVYGPDGIAPAEGVLVTASGMGSGFAYSGPDGTFAIAGLAPGTYSVSFDTTERNVTLDPDLVGRTYPEIVSVVADDTFVLDNVALAIPGAIAGHLYAADGITPLEGVDVWATDSMGMPFTSALTDQYGFYQLYGIAASAKVWFSPTNYNGMNGTAYRAEYYDNATSSFMAQDVWPGSIGIDAVLTEGASISGTVYGPDGTTPLEGVVVRAGWMNSAVTRSDGTYTVSGLTTGVYAVQFDPAGYNLTAPVQVIGEWYSDAYDQMNADYVSVSDATPATGIDATLAEASIITGTVYAPDGVTGLENVSVFVSFEESGTAGYWSGQFSTGPGGVYTAYVPVGTHVVSFDTEEYNQSNGTSYVTEWWNDVYVGFEAQPIPIGTGETVSGIDATLEVGGTISGTVRGPDGLGVPGVDVNLSASNGAPLAGVYSGADGSYSLTGLVPGTYMVYFDTFFLNQMGGRNVLSEYYLDTRDSRAALPIEVTLGSVASGIDADLEAGGTITGTVYAADGVTPLSGVGVSAMGTGYGSATTTESGGFEIKALIDGEYTVRFDPSGRNQMFATDYIAEYYDGVQLFADASPVSVAIATETSDINATLDTGGWISGTVYGPDGTTGISNVSVMVDDSGVSASTSFDGSYVLRGLPQGSHVLRFDPSMHNMMSSDGLLTEYYLDARVAADALPVEVNVGEGHSGVDAVLDQGGIIEGTVYAPDGVTLLQGVRVYAYGADGGSLESDLTGAEGTYRIMGLEPGDYTVWFSASEYNYDEDAGLLDEYYLDARTEDVAQLVWAEPGMVATGIDATLEEGALLSGLVTGDGGAFLPGVEVIAHDVASGSRMAATVEPDGTWTMRGVAPGDYAIEYNPMTYNVDEGTSYVREYWNDKATLTTADPITVGLAEMHDLLDAQLAQGGQSLTVTVGLPPDIGIPWQWIDLYERLADGSEQWVAAIEPLGGETVSVFRGLAPGDYLLRAEVDGLDYRAVWAYSQQPTTPQYYGTLPEHDAIRMDFADAIPVTTADVSVQMDPPEFGTVEGSVIDSVGDPLPGIRADFYRESASGEWIPVEWTWSDMTGALEYVQLVPGTYKAFFYDEYDEYGVGGAWYLDAMDDLDATTFEVLPGGLVTLDPQVLPLGGGGLSTMVTIDPEFPGASGWYAAAPTITLTCTDPTATIWYYWGADAPAEYTGPLTAPEGINTLTVWAEDLLGNLEPETPWDFQVDTMAPAAPTNLSAVPAGPNSVDLSWDAALDDTSGVDYYNVYVDDVYNGMWSGTSYQAVGLDPDTSYSFTVTAVDWAGHESAASDAALATTDPDSGSTMVPVFRLYQTTNGAQLLTANPAEVDMLLTMEPDKFVSEGIAFFTDPALDTTPVWRFRSIAQDTYFYTSSIVERDQILTMWPFLYEFQGPVFNCSPMMGSTPVYRFYRPSVGDRLLVASLAERDNVLVNYGGTYLYEGVGMYVNGSLTTATGTGSISGTVFDDTGAVLGGAWVRATGVAGTWSTLTAPDGTYTIAGLPDNDYVVTFSTWPNSELTGWQLLPEYYPDAHTYLDAIPVTIAGGAAQSGIDAQLEGPGPDLIKPITSITTSGTVGLDGWYSTEPSITLAPDEPATTYYTWNGVDIQQFTGPIHPALGITTLQFWSEDLAGNSEDTQTVGFKYDNVLPTTPAGFSAVQSSVGGDVTLTWTSSEDTISGMLRYLAFEQIGMGWSQVATITPVPGLDQSCVLPGVAEGGHTYSVVAVDNAGNRSAYSTSDYLSVDRTTPTTSAVRSGGLISNGWYVIPPSITLTPSEPGCTTYFYWGADAPGEYTGPLTAPDGINTLSFWSEDTVGHIESLESTGPIPVDTIAPAGVTGLTATVVGTSAVDLSWDAVTTDIFGDPEASGVAQYTVVVDFDTYTTTDTSFRVTGLTPDTYYEFGVIASDVPGNPGPTVTTSATTDPDLTAPTTSIVVTGGAVGANGFYTTAPSITLSSDEPGTIWYQWDTDATASEYAGAFEPIAGQHTLTYWSEDSVGNVEDPKPTQAFRLDTTAPATPTGLSAGQTAPGSVTISWNAATDAESGLDTHVLAQSGPQTGSWNVSGSTYTVTGLAEGTYSYTVEAVNVAGLHSAASIAVEVTVDNTAPVTTLAADPTAADGSGGWYVTAPAITLTTEPGATISYHWDTQADDTYGTPLTPAEGTHTLSFHAADAFGNTETPLHTATFKVDTVDPSAPTGLIATAPSFSTVDLAWSAATDATSGVVKYRIYQGATFLGDTTALTHQVTGLTGDTPYSFTVTAVDAAGNEGPASAAGDVRTPGEPLTGTFVIDGGATHNTTKALTFTSDVAGAAEMRIRASADGGTTWGSWGDWGAYAASIDMGVGTDGTWTYEIEYRNGARGVTLQDSIVVDSTGPVAPTGLDATPASRSAIDLSWNAATDASGIAKYTVFYANGTKIADVTAPATTYTVTGLSAGTAYSFYVTATDTLGNESAASATAGATTVAPPAAPIPVHRFYNTRTGTHFYTSDPAEMQRVRDTMGNIYTYEGVGYYLNTANPANSAPLYRFYNKRNGTHLYTADEGEKNNILNTLGAIYSLDGVAYNVSMTGGTAVHRFFSPSKGVHFYSSDPAEIANVRANLAHIWQYEGPAYYVAQ